MANGVTGQPRTGDQLAGARAIAQTHAGSEVPGLDELRRASTSRKTTAAHNSQGLARIASTWQRPRGYLLGRCLCCASLETANEIELAL
jgi:hypothetical protein